MTPLGRADLGELAVAAGILIVVLLLASFLGARLGRWVEPILAPRLAEAENFETLPTEHVAWSIGAVLAIALLTIAAAGNDWQPYPHALFDLTIPLASSVAAWHIALVFQLSRSAALAIALTCGFVVLTKRFEQLDFVATSLDGFAVTLGHTRISLLDVVSALFAGVVLYALVRLAIRGARALIRRRSDLDTTQRLLAEKIAAIVIAVIAIFVGIDVLGIDTTALSVFSGTIGLGLGFGLQKIFSNLVSGIILLMDRSVKPGDVIVVGGAVGEVNRIGTRAVSVITRDGKEHLIPNELLMTERVENWNFSSRDVRIRMSVRVAYESDIERVETLLLEAMRESPRVLDTPAPAVRITDISNSGVDVELRFWIRDPEDGLGNIQSEIFKRILAKFRSNDIILSNPARDVQITGLPPIALTDRGEG